MRLLLVARGVVVTSDLGRFQPQLFPTCAARPRPIAPERRCLLNSFPVPFLDWECIPLFASHLGGEDSRRPRRAPDNRDDVEWPFGMHPRRHGGELRHESYAAAHRSQSSAPISIRNGVTASLALVTTCNRALRALYRSVTTR